MHLCFPKVILLAMMAEISAQNNSIVAYGAIHFTHMHLNLTNKFIQMQQGSSNIICKLRTHNEYKTLLSVNKTHVNPDKLLQPALYGKGCMAKAESKQHVHTCTFNGFLHAVRPMSDR